MNKKEIKKDVDIVIPILNNLEYTKQCLESIIKCTKILFRIIIIDNNSTDGSEKWIKEYLEQNKIKFKYIKNKTNRGVGPAWNQGLKASNADYIAIINNDIVVSDNWLKNLIKPFKDKNIGLTTPIASDGDVIPEDFYNSKIVDGMKKTSKFGCCFVLPRYIFKKVGYFDERFKMAYYEDTDYLYRLWENGFELMEIFSSRIHHFVSKTANEIGGGGEYIHKNKMKLYKKYSKYNKTIPILFLVYNRLAYTKIALKSLLKTEGKFKIYIIDNKSNKATKKWLKTIKNPKIKVIFNHKNKGVAASMDQFFNLTCNDAYVAKVDNDTIVSKNWLKELLMVVRLNNIDIVQAKHPIRHESYNNFEEWMKDLKSIEFENSKIYFSKYVGGSAIVIKRQKIKEKISQYSNNKLLHGWTQFQYSAPNIISAFYDGVEIGLLDMIDDNKSVSKYKNYSIEMDRIDDINNKPDMIIIETVYRITSPSNFSPDPHIENGTSKIYFDIPEWAKNNGNICVEELNINKLDPADDKDYRTQINNMANKNAHIKDGPKGIEKGNVMREKNNKDCFIVGTRPDIIKSAPLILKMNPFVIHTGQHKELSNEAFECFEIEPDVNFDLMTENQSLTGFFSMCIIELDRIIKENNFDRIWVQGDTSSALAGAFVAFVNKIPLVHIEAGLRTYKNNPFPEEMFRTQIDRMADIMFAPTKQAIDNLKNENLQGRAYLVGNTVVDALKMIQKILPKKRPIEEKYVLATIHRRESFGDDMEQIFLALKELSKTIKVVLPAHPNPNVQDMIMKIGLETVSPMSYKDFLWHLKFCEYVISDSGGVLEECPSFKKKVIILRKETERQELIEKGYGILVKDLKKDNILKNIKKFISKNIVFGENPFGDGRTSNRIIAIIEKHKKSQLKTSKVVQEKIKN